MLFYLTDSLIVDDDAEAFDGIFKTISICLTAAEEGKHLVYGDHDVLTWFKNNLGKDRLRHLVDSLLNNEFAMSIPSFLTEYVEIVNGNDSVRTENGVKIYSQSYTHFTNTCNIDNTHLVFEDENDCDFYSLIAKWKISQTGTTVPIAYFKVAGAGGLLSRTAQTHIDAGYLVLCITDTDKRYPGAPEGDTCNNCNAIVFEEPRHHFYKLDVHEAENLLPKSVIDCLTWDAHCARNKAHYDGLYNGIADKDKLRYFDMKSGFKIDDNFLRSNDWISFAKECCDANPEITILGDFAAYVNNSSNFGHVIHLGLRRTLLKDSIAYMKTNSYLPAEADFLPYQLSEWNNIGQLMINCCIARTAGGIY